jgi:hypothetical protein
MFSSVKFDIRLGRNKTSGNFVNVLSSSIPCIENATRFVVTRKYSLFSIFNWPKICSAVFWAIEIHWINALYTAAELFLFMNPYISWHYIPFLRLILSRTFKISLQRSEGNSPPPPPSFMWRQFSSWSITNVILSLPIQYSCPVPLSCMQVVFCPNRYTEKSDLNFLLLSTTIWRDLPKKIWYIFCKKITGSSFEENVFYVSLIFFILFIFIIHFCFLIHYYNLLPQKHEILSGTNEPK